MGARGAEQGSRRLSASLVRKGASSAVPTLALHEALGRSATSNLKSDSTSPATRRPSTRTNGIRRRCWRATGGRRPFCGLQVSVRQLQQQFVQRFARAVDVSSPAPTHPSRMLYPGVSLHRELQLLGGVRRLSPAAAIRSEL